MRRWFPLFFYGTVALGALISVAYAQSDQQPLAYPQKGWPAPVEDSTIKAFVLADILEYQPSMDGGDVRWDAQSWIGGDYNRVWFKSEGQRNTAFKADYDIDAQVLYGRFVKRYFDFQIGARMETQSFENGNATRAHAVIGIEGLVPYNFEFEPLLFISQNGDVSGRITFSKDIFLTQRWVIQGRLEANFAAQRVERFTTGTGLNNLEGGFRLRYEMRREFAPYVGISLDRSFFDTADLVRQQGGDAAQIRFAAGIRFWR